MLKVFLSPNYHTGKINFQQIELCENTGPLIGLSSLLALHVTKLGIDFRLQVSFSLSFPTQYSYFVVCVHTQTFVISLHACLLPVQLFSVLITLQFFVFFGVYAEVLSIKRSPLKYFIGELYGGNSLRSTISVGNEKKRQRVYNTMFHVPFRCERVLIHFTSISLIGIKLQLPFT